MSYRYIYSICCIWFYFIISFIHVILLQSICVCACICRYILIRDCWFTVSEMGFKLKSPPSISMDFTLLHKFLLANRYLYTRITTLYINTDVLILNHLILFTLRFHSSATVFLVSVLFNDIKKKSVLPLKRTYPLTYYYIFLHIYYYVVFIYAVHSRVHSCRNNLQ